MSVDGNVVLIVASIIDLSSSFFSPHTAFSAASYTDYSIRTVSPSPPRRQIPRKRPQNPTKDKRHKPIATMNVQPPVHDRLIIFPNAAQRDVVDPGRKPSLVPGGKPHPIRGHVVAVSTRDLRATVQFPDR